eukprot:gene19973-23934_t
MRRSLEGTSTSRQSIRVVTVQSCTDNKRLRRKSLLFERLNLT